MAAELRSHDVVVVDLWLFVFVVSGRCRLMGVHDDGMPTANDRSEIFLNVWENKS